MASVDVSRTIRADVEALNAAIDDLEEFMAAAGFDEVRVDEPTIEVANRVGPIEIELVLSIIEDPDAVLAYEQVEGIFERMTTTYSLTPVRDGVCVEIATEFAIDTAVVGPVFDATIIKHQRRKELNAQLDYLDAQS